MGSNIIELAKLGHERAAELKASCGAVDVRSLAQLISDLATQLEVQLVRGNALAAENAGLNDKMNKLATWPGIEFYSSAWEFCNLDGNDALEFMCDVKTPATDAFLAEVRASGVEMFGQYHNFSEKLFIQKEAQKFAAKLRKGDKS
ncbi:hypothetical protein VC136_24545 [Citrobacter freundii]|nr:hypothetical protein [Citrobacter freundii]MEB2760014.1 hypothetical protein [Citrobacter freundii]